MSLPRKVQEAADLADALYKEMYEPQAPAAEAEPAQPEQEPASPVEQPDSIEQTSSTDQLENQPTNEGSQENPDNQGNGDWEHRYKVLSGKYSSEVPRLAAENREFKSMIKQMEQKIENLAKAGSTNKESLIRSEEIDEYGEPLIDIIRRAAREELASKDAEIQELKSRMESFDSKVSRNVEVDFYEDLGRRVPEWVAINDDQNFHKWLEGYDELTGQRRQELLSSAEAERDARRVSNFFNAYVKTSKSWAASANQRLESQVVPQTQTHNDPPQSKRVWTRGDVADFYDRLKRGSVSGSEAVAIEADIQAAAVEGRIK